ncbi:MAG: hypothetical protein NVV62_00230 [Terricaulis sp.]|nr:hypothetical protein [Terricaulis sp.]
MGPVSWPGWLPALTAIAAVETIASAAMPISLGARCIQPSAIEILNRPRLFSGASFNLD